MRIFRRFPFIRRRYYLHLIAFICIALILFIERKNHSYSTSIGNVSIDSISSVVTRSTSLTSPVSRSTSSQPSLTKISNARSINSTFRNELIDQRLKSHFSMYENSSQECDMSKPLTTQQNQTFSTILKSLDSLRQQLVPYPNDYFHGRGIVFSVGLRDIKLIRSNLKVIALIDTRLPIQVNRNINELFIISLCLMKILN